MTLHLHHLHGCAAAPLALYLKAIGILRLVGEQVDSQARGWWENEHFCLLTRLDREALERFFLDDYAPTPFLSPWNKGSGFYKENDPGLVPIEESLAPRFDQFRKAISDARELLHGIAEADAAIRAIKDRTKTTKAFQSQEQRELLRASRAFRRSLVQVSSEKEKLDDESKRRLISEIESIAKDADKPPSKAEANRIKKLDGYKRLLREAEKEFKELKSMVLPGCRRSWRGLHASWMSAGVVLNELGEPQFPSLLGTGGNDGNLDFTNNAMLRLGELFDLSTAVAGPREHAPELLRDCLWAAQTNRLSGNAIGQFLPGSGGGANSSTGAGGSPSVNPWDFVLMLEGAVSFSARATRRFDHLAETKASAPFAVHAHAAGFASAGDEKNTRGEQWMPLWNRPAVYGDIAALLSEGRLQLGRQTVNRPVDAARAISRLGAARGVSEFTRYGFLERNGQSTLAVPLGRVHVTRRPYSNLIDDIAAWMRQLQRLARESSTNHPPARLVHAERRLANAVFDALTHDHTPDRWQLILAAMVDIEAIQQSGTAIQAQPIPRLQPSWIKASADDSSEFRLALALGSSAKGYKRNGPPVDSVRHHWLPLKPGVFRFRISDKRLTKDARVVITGRDPVADCAAIVQRRLIESEQNGERNLPLKAAFRCDARLDDLARLLSGGVDLNRVLLLSRALMSIDWQRWDPGQHLPEMSKPDDSLRPDEAWLAIRLTCLPSWKTDTEHDSLRIPCEPAMVSRLLAGDGSAAVRIASRRLSVSGIRVPFQSAITDSQTARLWAAALVFPISRRTASLAVKSLVPNYIGESS